MAAAARRLRRRRCGGGQTRLEPLLDGLGRRRRRVDRPRLAALGSTPIPAVGRRRRRRRRAHDKLIGLPLGERVEVDVRAPARRAAGRDGQRRGRLGRRTRSSRSTRTTGRLLWRRPTGASPLLGAGDDGTVTVVTFRKAGGAGSVLLAVAHDGQVVRQIETDKPLGAPAVLGRPRLRAVGRPVRLGHRSRQRRRGGARHAARADEPRVDAREARCGSARHRVHPLRRAHQGRLEGEGDDRDGPRRASSPARRS